MDTHPNIAVVHVGGDLDVTTVPRTRRLVEGLIDDGCRRIILNMAAATAIDSTGLGFVLGEIRRMRSVGGLLSITEANECVMRTLRLSRLVDFAPVSGAGGSRQVQELPASAVPLWRCVVRIDPSDLAGTRASVERHLSRVGMDSDCLFDLMLTVGEAIGNAIDHAAGECALVVLACYEDRVVIDVTDCGCGFELRAGEAVPRVDETSERGRGIRLMRLLADSVTIGRKPWGKGTLVRIVKLRR
ncbi:anti-sigma factor antagonist [Olsenella sp. HMSC062G07]|uniref:anti-sigma factor antagonist n=1 Tax=Olsenella sp. HMSC062G07 TaxID=1739330 RepID=UPI0008A28498|nr:anti-sigma factor antagonist [Olsenella sp. HMSC062G07]OFK23351.1 anti-anti-sigma factor [Olsenella sp. HMSC062G07]